MTIVAQLREPFFGEIRNEEMIFNDAGRMVHTAWESLPERFPNIELDIFQVMPNHFHGIIVIHDVGATLVVAPDATGTRPPDRAGTRLPDRAGTRLAPTLGDVVGAFKSITTHEYIVGVDKLGWMPFYKKLWQRNYFEHIIRDQADYERIANYIAANPVNWAEDEENPKNAPQAKGP